MALEFPIAITSKVAQGAHVDRSVVMLRAKVNVELVLPIALKFALRARQLLAILMYRLEMNLHVILAEKLVVTLGTLVRFQLVVDPLNVPPQVVFSGSAEFAAVAQEGAVDRKCGD